MIAISRAVAADAATVADIYLESRASAGEAIPPGVHPREDVHRHVAEVTLVRSQVWLAQDGPEPVGVLVLGDGQVSPDDPAPVTELDWLWVRPQWQGAGVGSALLEHAKKTAPEGLALWAFVTNTPARTFYEKRGFVAVARTDGSANEENAPDIRYLWRPMAGIASDGPNT